MLWLLLSRAGVTNSAEPWLWQLHMAQHQLLSGMQGRLQAHNLKWSKSCGQLAACNQASRSCSAIQQGRAARGTGPAGSTHSASGIVLATFTLQ